MFPDSSPDIGDHSCPRLVGIHIYPVKGCRGISLSEGQVEERGLAWDRRWMIVDETGMLLSQRQIPEMALIETQLLGNDLILRNKTCGDMRVKGGPSNAFERDHASRRVTIWRDTVIAEDTGNEAADWLSASLGRHCRLVKLGEDSRRVIPAERVTPSLRNRERSVSFADGFPLLVVSEASLAELNSRLDEPLPMDRFRPNLVISGVEAFAEDEWGEFQIGDVVFHTSGKCGRCVVTTTNQETAERGKEPLRTLAQYRTDDRGEVCFGQNVIPEKFGAVRVGDKLIAKSVC